MRFDPNKVNDVMSLQGPDGRPLLYTLYDLFVQDSEGHISLAKRKLETDTADDELMRAFHTMKSTAGNVGASDLSAVSAVLEQAARDKDMEKLKRSINSYYKLYQESRDALKEFLIAEEV